MGYLNSSKNFIHSLFMVLIIVFVSLMASSGSQARPLSINVKVVRLGSQNFHHMSLEEMAAMLPKGWPIPPWSFPRH
ncbi:hypothetical protein PanWU01x14_361520 [Parasponia andersonii]|uniref:Transmembrane protein n=1 Tax=Parasponia andersonii TaxID=3476 RepID=A0A2P5A7B1_PARAD|nr:hypothetical protein PanWU01x14_361520 [Parasponia andersonii]